MVNGSFPEVNDQYISPAGGCPDMGLVSAIWGLVALAAMCVAFVPLLGLLNWFVIPFAAVGIVLGYLAKGEERERGRSLGKTGFICSLVALLLSMFRLLVGGGVV
jgi:hypothetical protein